MDDNHGVYSSQANSKRRHPNRQALLLSLIRRWRIWLPPALLLLAAGLRFHLLGNKNIWWDEGLSVNFARMPLRVMADSTAHDVHPPLYFACLHVWRLLSGDTEFALRLPSALAGVLILAVTYRLTRTLAGVPAAIGALTCLTFMRLPVWYAQELRPYALAPLWSVSALALTLPAWRQGRWNWPAWFGYVGVATAGLYTLYFTAALLAAQNMAALLFWWRRRPSAAFIWRWLAAQAAVAALFLPWVVYFWPRVHHYFTEPTTLGPSGVLELYLNTLFVGNPDHLDRHRPAVALGLAVSLLGGALCLGQRRRRRTDGQFFGLSALWSSFAIMIGFVWIVNLPWDLKLTFNPEARYFAIQLPWAAVLLGMALASLAQWRRLAQAVVVIGGLLIGVWIYHLGDYYAGRHLRDDYKSAAATLNAYRQPDDAALLQTDSDWPLIAYAFGNDWRGVNNGRRITDDALAAEYARPAWENHAGIWLLLTPEALASDPDRRIFAWLSARAVAQREFHYDPALRLFFFARSEARAASIDQLVTVPAPTMNVSPAAGLTLTRAEWVLPAYRVGEMVRLFLFWRNNNAIGVYPFEVRLTTSAGQVAEAIPTALTVTAASPELIRQQVDFPLRAHLSTGNYGVDIVAGKTWAALGRLRLTAAPPHAPPETPPENVAVIRFANGLELQGWTLNAAGRQVEVRLYWSTTAVIDRRYKMFVHLRGADSRQWAQSDREPAFGGAPLTTWRPGETVAEVIQLFLPPEAPAGFYNLTAGWYDPFTGERLPVIDDAGVVTADHISLPPLRLE